MTLYLLSKYNPFAVSSASSNRYVGLLKGLFQQNCKITILITGGYYNVNEKETFEKEGSRLGLNYVYLNTFPNTTLNNRRIYEFFLKSLIAKIVALKFRKAITNTAKDYVLWIMDDIVNYKITNSLQKAKNQLMFMELNEFPDIHLLNNSTKYFWQKNAANKTKNYFENYILSNLNGLALMTNTLMDYFKPYCNPKTKLLHLPMTVDLERFDLNKHYPNTQNLPQSYIAFVGSMNDAKDGVNILIEAFVKIAKDFPNIHLCLYGFWAYETQKHLDLIKNSGLEHRILYSKAIDSSEVINVLMNATLLVLPRPDSHQARGGFPTKLGEYLATSKPVVSTRVGEIPLYLKDQESVFFCEPGSVESLANAMTKALADPQLAFEVGLKGRIVAENEFASSIQAKKLKEFLNQLN